MALVSPTLSLGLPHTTEVVVEVLTTARAHEVTVARISVVTVTMTIPQQPPVQQTLVAVVVVAVLSVRLAVPVS